jgi:hypothetical protein
MGYRSEVHIAVAFDSKKNMDEVIAAYALNINVEKHNLVNDWVIKDDNILYFHADHVKWYDDYEWVQGYEYMFELVKEFCEARGFSSAYRLLRVGESDDDVEDRSDWFDGDYEHNADDDPLFENEATGLDDTDTTLIDKLMLNMEIVRKVEVTL